VISVSSEDDPLDESEVLRSESVSMWTQRLVYTRHLVLSDTLWVSPESARSLGAQLRFGKCEVSTSGREELGLSMVWLLASRDLRAIPNTFTDVFEVKASGGLDSCRKSSKILEKSPRVD